MLSVITVATDRNLAQLAAVKQELQVVDGGDDSYIETLIRQVSASVEKWCGRPLVADTVREIFHLVSPTAPLILSRYPVVSIVSATMEGGTLPAEQYEVDRESGFFYRLSATGAPVGWPAGRVIVDYQAGYVAPGGIPPDIERAVVLAVADAYLARGRDSTLKSEDVDDVSSVTYALPLGLPSAATDLLAPYRSPAIA